MPGREVGLPTGTAKYGRRLPSVPYDAVQKKVNAKAVVSKSGQESRATTPACKSCLEILQSIQRVRKALEDVLRNAKVVFLDDTLHHQMGDERWVRMLRVLGEDKSVYYARNIAFNSVKSL